MSTIYDWSTTPGSNATADAQINWAEGMFPSAVNDSARQMMARVAQWLDDNGVLDTLGTNTIAVTTNSPITAIETGMTLAFRAAATNTTAVTLNVNGLGGKDIRKIVSGVADSVALDAGDINIKGIYVVHFDATTNGGAGAWIITNPITQMPPRLQENVLVVTNLDTILADGFYGNAPGATGSPENTNGFTQHLQFDATTAQQFWTEAFGVVRYFRQKLGGAWGAWARYYGTQAELDVLYQRVLGFIPVQQNGGANMGNSKIFIGYRTDSKLGLKIDATDFNSTWPISISGAAVFAPDSTNAVNATNAGNSNTLNGLSAAQITANAIAGSPRGGVGVGQSWHNVNRNTGTWFTNNTGQPIFFAVDTTGTCQIHVAIDNNASVPALVAEGTGRVGATIPSGQGYRHTSSAGYVTWELS